MLTIVLEFGMSDELAMDEYLASTHDRVDVIPILCPVEGCPSEHVPVTLNDRDDDSLKARCFCPDHERHFTILNSRTFALLYRHCFEQLLLLRWEHGIQEHVITTELGISPATSSRLETAAGNEVLDAAEALTRLEEPSEDPTPPEAPEEHPVQRIHLDVTGLERTDRQRMVAFPTTQDQDILAVMEMPRDNSRVYEDLVARIISITESISELLCSVDEP